jgi:hypothetical protein
MHAERYPRSLSNYAEGKRESRMHDQEPQPPTFWQMLQSVLAAAFGVQSGKNRARDFNHGKPSYFVALGLLFTLCFVLTIFGLVKLVLYYAGI